MQRYVLMMKYSKQIVIEFLEPLLVIWMLTNFALQKISLDFVLNDKVFGKFVFSDAIRKKTTEIVHRKPFFPCTKPWIVWSTTCVQINWFRVYIFFVRKLLCNLLIYSHFNSFRFYSHQTATHSEYFMQTETYLPQILTNIYWMICWCVIECVCVSAWVWVY